MNPKFNILELVYRKFFGVGRIDQRRPAGEHYEYHVQFEKTAGGFPEGDLRPATEAALAGPRREG